MWNFLWIFYDQWYFYGLLNLRFWLWFIIALCYLLNKCTNYYLFATIIVLREVILIPLFSVLGCNCHSWKTYYNYKYFQIMTLLTVKYVENFIFSTKFSISQFLLLLALPVFYYVCYQLLAYMRWNFVCEPFVIYSLLFLESIFYLYCLYVFLSVQPFF